MRYLGLDVGKKTIGLAVGEILASELSTIRAPKEIDFYSAVGSKLAYQQIVQIVAAEQVKAIVAGLPVDEDGQPTEESTRIRGFCQQMESVVKLPIHFVDETLTSFMAEDMLESQGADKNEIEARVHQLAAELILQQYLEGEAEK